MDDKINNLNSGHLLTPLIDFDFIVNTELGLIRYIRDQYQDSRAFDINILNKSDREILSLLYSRKNPNPLAIISTEDNITNIDPLYDSFFENKKREIINMSSCEPSIITFVNMAILSGANLGINPFIAVKDDMEREQIILHFGRANIVYKSEVSDIISKDPFYIRDYRFFTDEGIYNIAGKKIYMSPRQYNIDYFEKESNSLTNKNVFVLTGIDYRANKDQEENKNG